MNTRINHRLAACLTAGLVALSAAAMALSTGSAFARPDGSKNSQKSGADDKDRIIMKDGRILEGKIVKETDQEIEFQIIMSSGLTATRPISRSDILDIKRAAQVDEKPNGTTPNKAGEVAKPKNAAAPATNETKVYVIPLTGEFSRDVALSPLKRVMEDAKNAAPDILVVKIDCDYKISGQQRPDWDQQPGVYDQLELAREIEPLFTDQIRHDPEWKTKPRLVFWIKKALGGAAFLPFFCHELYYTSDAKHGGIGYLDYLFEGVGDEVVREKQRSLRQGRLEGLAIEGGHPVEIIRAMARVDYVLSVNWIGGRPEFHPDDTGEVLLTDDGSKESGHRDNFEDIIRFSGNDVLTLTADMALRLGMSNGTCDTADELYDKLGISRDSPTSVGRAKDILEEWSKGVSESEFTIRRLLREYEKVEVRPPGGYLERTQARGRRKAILKDILALLEKYGEAINPREIGASPENLKKKIHIDIEIIEQEQRRDKPDHK